MKLVSRILIALMVLSVLLVACAPAAQQETKFKVGQVTDLGGIDDKSFNAAAYAGIEDAVKQLDVDGKYLESQGQSDYAKNIQQFLDEDTDLIVTVGFLLGVDTALTAKANPISKWRSWTMASRTAGKALLKARTAVLRQRWRMCAGWASRPTRLPSWLVIWPLA